MSQGTDAGGGRDTREPASLHTRQVRGSTVLTAGRVAATLLTLATQVVLVRALTKGDFGLFAYGLTVSIASRYLLSLGQGRSLSRFMSLYHEEQDYGRLLGTMLLAVGTVLATTAVLFAGALLVLDDLDVPVSAGADATTVLLVLLCLAPLEALDKCFVALFAVFSRPRTIFVRKYLLTPGLRLAVVLVLVALDRDVLFLALGYVAAGVVGIGVYTALTVSLLRRQSLLGSLRTSRVVVPAREVLKFSVVMLSTDLVFLSMSTGTVLLLGYVAGLVEVADYRAVFPAARLNQFVFASFTTLFLPMASRLFARRDRTAMADAYWRTALLVMTLSFPVFLLTAPFAAATTTTLFGARYADSALVLAILSTGYFVNVALGFNAVVLQVYGRLRFVLLANCGMAVLNLGLAAALVHAHGAVGVAVANALTLVVQNVVNQWALRRTIGTSFLPRAHLRPYALAAVLAAALGVLAAALTPGILLSVLLAAAATVVLLGATRGQLGLDELFPELARVPVLGRLLVPAPPPR